MSVLLSVSTTHTPCVQVNRMENRPYVLMHPYRTTTCVHVILLWHCPASGAPIPVLCRSVTLCGKSLTVTWNLQQSCAVSCPVVSVYTVPFPIFCPESPLKKSFSDVVRCTFHRLRGMSFSNFRYYHSQQRQKTDLKLIVFLKPGDAHCPLELMVRKPLEKYS